MGNLTLLPILDTESYSRVSKQKLCSLSCQDEAEYVTFPFAHLILNPTSQVTASGETSYKLQLTRRQQILLTAFLHSSFSPFERAPPSNGSLRFAPGKIFGETETNAMELYRHVGKGQG